MYIYSIAAYGVVCLWLSIAWITEGQTQIIVCPSKLLFHIPCPGCGVTRATLLWMHGHIKDALFLNPNVLFSMAFIGGFPILLIVDVVYKRGVLTTIYDKINAILCRKWVFITFLALELCIWIHNILYHI